MAKQKILLHTCCGPCSTVAIERLEGNFDSTGFFYNPNIYPAREYRKRFHDAEDFFEDKGITLIEGDYDPDAWLRGVKGLEKEPEGGRRCDTCIAMRLRETAKVAKNLGIYTVGTTLSVSPFKNTSKVNDIGKRMVEEYGVKWLDVDFSAADGYKRSLELSREYDLYRQDYCGCIFSYEEMKRKRKL